MFTLLTTSCSVEIAVRAADHFTRLYYKTYDSSTRVDDLPNFYRPSSALTWNGTPYQGADGVRELISKMPATSHDVQSFDCHPISGQFALQVRSCRQSAYRRFREPATITTYYREWDSNTRQGPCGKPGFDTEQVH